MFANAIAVNLVSMFAVSQLAKFGASTNWDQAKSQIDGHLKAIHPAWVEGEVETTVNAFLDACSVVCQDKDDVEALIKAACSGDIAGAVADLKAVVLKALPPHGAVTTQLAGLLAPAAAA